MKVDVNTLQDLLGLGKAMRDSRNKEWVESMGQNKTMVHKN